MSEATGSPFVPVPSALTQPFWQHAANGILTRQECQDCGYNMFPPQFACRVCLGTNLQWVASSGRGRLYSYTIVHMSDEGRPLTEPAILADVDLEEGWHMLTNVVDCPLDDLAFGMDLSVTWRRLSPEVNLPVFEPVQRLSES